MPRVPRTADFRGDAKPTPTDDAPGAALLASLGPEKKKRRRTPSDAKRGLAEAISELVDVLAGRRKPEPKHLVGLYAHMHEAVYGVVPEELRRPNEFMGATSAARKMTAEAFDDRIADAIEFMRWVWRRERDMTKWRRAKGVPIRRVDWRRQFVFRDLVTDYRAAIFEKGERGAGR